MNSALFLGVVTFALIFFAAIGYFIAYVSGWSEAARAYPGSSYFSGTLLSFRSAACRRWTHYSMCLVFGANQTGLYMAVLPIFRAGHPPIFVPWSEVTVTRHSPFGLPTVRFSFARTPGVWFAVWPGLASRLLASAPPSVTSVAAA